VELHLHAAKVILTILYVMQILFCSSPLDAHKPDSVYELEVAAVERLDISLSLIDFEALVYENDGSKAVRNVRKTESGEEIAVYRGWMLSPEKYQLLYDALRNRGISLINDPASYKHCHYLPEWFPLLADQTPDSIWIDKDILGTVPGEDAVPAHALDLIMEKLRVFQSQPVILKDFVKSEKHHWADACFIPSALDRDHVGKVVSRFLELRGWELEGGLVFRKFINFKALTTHSKSGMPLTKEFRFFVLDGTIIHCLNYWEEGDYGDLQPPVEFFAAAAKKPRSRFFTMDLGQTEEHDWSIIELGDAQVAGLPHNAPVDSFYKSLWERLKS